MLRLASPECASCEFRKASLRSDRNRRDSSHLGRTHRTFSCFQICLLFHPKSLGNVSETSPRIATCSLTRTGGASGIGASAALQLARAGANVAIADLPKQAELGMKVVEQIVKEAPDSKAFFLGLDVREDGDWERVLDELGNAESSSDFLSFGCLILVSFPICFPESHNALDLSTCSFIPPESSNSRKDSKRSPLSFSRK